jgi:hypothetical protein
VIIRRDVIAAVAAALSGRLSQCKRLSQVLFLTCAVAELCSANLASAQILPWMNRTLAPEQRAAWLVSAMTLDEKIQQIAMNPVAN